MKTTTLRLLGGMLASLILGLASGVHAQNGSPPASQAATPMTAEQLDQTLAPIALYPDPLVAQILTAATYPLEIVEADRWLQQPVNAALQGSQLSDALAPQPWDPSVKSLVPFPQVLAMLDDNLEWTERLGDAFLASQPAVMDSIQRLRQRAQAAGTLQSIPQETVSQLGQDIMIQPPAADTVYVPVYDPTVAFGAWPYPGYPPYAFPNDFYGAVAGPFGFGWVSVAIVVPLWGWGHCDWHRHQIDLDRGRFAALNRHHAPPGVVWTHDPWHRHGVPYGDPVVQRRFAANAGVANAAAADTRLPHAAPGVAGTPGSAHPQGFAVPRVARVPMPPVAPEPRVQGAQTWSTPRVQAPRVPQAPPAQTLQPMPHSGTVIVRVVPGFVPPAGHNGEMQATVVRGRVSGMAMPAPHPTGSAGRSTTSEGVRPH
jgi:hypothetical protein